MERAMIRLRLEGILTQALAEICKSAGKEAPEETLKDLLETLDPSLDETVAAIVDLPDLPAEKQQN